MSTDEHGKPLSYAFLFGALMFGVVALVLLAATTSGTAQALTMGFGALLGLCTIAFTQYLNAQAALAKARKVRLQEARGLARALASEIGIFGEVMSAKGPLLKVLMIAKNGNFEGAEPDDLVRVIELPSRVIFDANATNIPLLEVMEEYAESLDEEEGLVEQVVGFYESGVDFRIPLSSAMLQNRKLNQEEVSMIQDSVISIGKFAHKLSARLRELARRSEKPRRAEPVNLSV